MIIDIPYIVYINGNAKSPYLRGVLGRTSTDDQLWKIIPVVNAHIVVDITSDLLRVPISG